MSFRESIPPPEAKEQVPEVLDENANPTSWTPVSASPHHPRVGPSETLSPPMYPSPAAILEKLKSGDASAPAHDQTWTASTVKKYILLDSRRGLTELARRLVKGTDIGACEIFYQDYWRKVGAHTMNLDQIFTLELTFNV